MKRKPRGETKLRLYTNLVDNRESYYLASSNLLEVLVTLNSQDGKSDSKIIEGKESISCGDWCTLKTGKENR